MKEKYNKSFQQRKHGFWIKSLKTIIVLMILAMSVTMGIEANADEESNKDIVILYTNDVHNGYVRDDESFGYAAVAAYKKQMIEAGYEVILVDGGDALQGGVIGALSKGQYIVDIMEKLEYDVAIPGNHEFDFGMDNFLSIAYSASYKYISCNFMDLRTGGMVFEPYTIIEKQGKKIAIVGITTPETFSKSTPAYFKDENGEYIYGFCEGGDGKELYDQIQKAVDSALAVGVDYIIAIGHTGTESSSAPWRSTDIIANVSGIDVFLDAHSHSVIPNELHKDKNGEDVILCSTGTKLDNLGKLIIKSDGTITTELVDDIEADDEEVKAFIDDITKNFEDLVNKVVAKTEVPLVTNDPTTGERIIRSRETNLGDLCADAYRAVTGADVAFINGGGVREGIKVGDVTYGQIIAVNPFGNAICMIEVTGKQLLDALEMGMKMAGAGENGAYLHTSGITFDVNTAIESSVKENEQGEFISVDGAYRVTNVKVDGKPLELDKTYTLASHNYMLKSFGGGYVMFKDCKLILDEFMLDYEVLIKYISEDLGGNISKDSIYADPYGSGRCNIISEEIDVDTSDNTLPVVYVAMGMISVMLVLGCYRKRAR